MRSLNGKIIILGGAVGLVLVLPAIIVLSPHVPDPIYKGRYESEWFKLFYKLGSENQMTFRAVALLSARGFIRTAFQATS
jgi:hypothetical protein